MEGVTKTLQETSKSSKETMSATATKKGVHLVGIEVSYFPFYKDVDVLQVC